MAIFPPEFLMSDGGSGKQHRPERGNTMSRVTRHLAVVTLAAGIMAAPLATSPAWAAGDGLVNVTIGNVTTTVPVTAAPQICVGDPTVLIAAFQKVDTGGSNFKCTSKVTGGDVKVKNN
jgi:hypothetical protein